MKIIIKLIAFIVYSSSLFAMNANPRDIDPYDLDPNNMDRDHMDLYREVTVPIGIPYHMGLTRKYMVEASLTDTVQDVVKKIQDGTGLPHIFEGDSTEALYVIGGPSGDRIDILTTDLVRMHKDEFWVNYIRAMRETYHEKYIGWINWNIGRTDPIEQEEEKQVHPESLESEPKEMSTLEKGGEAYKQRIHTLTTEIESHESTKNFEDFLGDMFKTNNIERSDREVILNSIIDKIKKRVL